MPAGRSFKEYVKWKCYDRLYQAASDYVSSNWDGMGLYLRKVNKVSETVLGIGIRDLDLLTIGMVNDMYAESRNDEYKYQEVATQEDFDRF